jgi:hypothetical protein
MMITAADPAIAPAMTPELLFLVLSSLWVSLVSEAPLVEGAGGASDCDTGAVVAELVVLLGLVDIDAEVVVAIGATPIVVIADGVPKTLKLE